MKIKLNSLINSWIPRITPCRHWIFLFVFLLAALSNRTGLSTNVMSRVALLLALTEKHSFEISPWEKLTIDWAKTPEGHYYSNKAPGPSLLAAPLFAALYKPLNSLINNRYTNPRELNLAWNNMMSFIMWFLCFVLQILPLAWVISRLAILLSEQNIPRSGILFFVSASMFGNTGDFYMNSFHGHGYATILSLAVILFILRTQWSAVGFSLGLGILGDYSSALLIPLVGLWVLTQERHSWLRIYLRLIRGLIIPVAIFAFYHWRCFGGVMTLPQKFQNPLFVDAHTNFENYGVISWFPNANILIQLLFGPIRGIFFTQPYILILSVILMVPFWKSLIGHRALIKSVSIGLLSILFFFGLLWMNAGFNGWHGGSAPGPRYLVSAFPCMAFAGALSWNQIGKAYKTFLWITLGFSILFFSVVLAAGQNPPQDQILISYYGKYFTLKSDSLQFWCRWVVVLFGLSYVAWRDLKSDGNKI